MYICMCVCVYCIFTRIYTYTSKYILRLPFNFFF